MPRHRLSMRRTWTSAITRGRAGLAAACAAGLLAVAAAVAAVAPSASGLPMIPTGEPVSKVAASVSVPLGSQIGLTRAGQSASSPLTAANPGCDYDGDGKSDVAVFRPDEGGWYLLLSGGGATGLRWGAAGDLPVCGDFDGDGATDVAVFRVVDGGWFIIRSGGGTTGLRWGQQGDVPVVGDYDGDGKSDIAVFRPLDGAWFIVLSSGGTRGVLWGVADDVPAPGDYDGDGTTDVAVFRDGAWFIVFSGGGTRGVAWGTAGDIPVPGDYDGDGKSDIAVFRPSTGTWFAILSSAAPVSSSFTERATRIDAPGGYVGYALNWGQSGDLVRVGDYDGDGITDPAVFRRTASAFFLHTSTQAPHAYRWGGESDLPASPLAPCPLWGFEGRWNGSWFHNGFGGTATMNVSVDMTTRKLGMEIDVGGLFLGVLDPAPETLNWSFTSTGLTISQMSGLFGNVTGSIAPDGALSGMSTDVPASGIDSVTYSGTATPNQITINHTVLLDDMSTATGVASFTRD